jgi:hypothetical protein
VLEHQNEISESVENSSNAEDQLCRIGKCSKFVKNHLTVVTVVTEDEHIAHNLFIPSKELVPLHVWSAELISMPVRDGQMRIARALEIQQA